MIIALSALIVVLLIVIVLMAFMRGGRGTTVAPPEHEAVVKRLREERAELERQHAVELQQLKDEAKAEFVNYAHEKDLEYEQKKRTDRQASNARSRTALVAKIAEHLSPLLEGFPYNFKDARHVGEIFDYLVFDGLEEGEIRKVVFLEVKTKRTGRVSNPREVMLREAIAAGRVSYEVFVPKIPPLPKEAAGESVSGSGTANRARAARTRSAND
jgi:predicted Holliday junction resolvase-like endonuclease